MERPTPVTVFGALNLVFGGLALITLPFSFFTLFAQPNSKNPVVKIVAEHPGFGLWMKIAAGLGIVSSLVLLAAGKGLLDLKPWGRILSIGYGVYAIALGLVGGSLNYIFLVGPLLAQAERARGPEAAGAIGGAIGIIFGTFSGMAYPVLLLFFMTRPAVVAAFRPPPEAEGPPA